jgi:hypothetical protein
VQPGGGFVEDEKLGLPDFGFRISGFGIFGRLSGKGLIPPDD